jgi:hypothetical protein
MASMAADIQRYFIPVELDRRRVLAFDNRATFLVFQRFGADFWRALYEPDPGNPKSFRVRSREAFEFFLWAAFLRDADAAGETLTLEDVAAFVLPDTIAELAEGLLVALSATRRRPAKKDEERKND